MRSRRGFVGGLVGSTALLAGCAGILDDSDGDDADDGVESEGESSAGGSDQEQRRRDLAASYRDGVESHNGGSLSYQRATSNYNVELWEMARDASSDSQSDLEEAIQSFDDAGTLAIELDETTVLDWCDEAQQKSELKRDAVEAMIAACDHAESGDLQQADQETRTANSASQEAENATIRDFSDVETAVDVDVRDPVTFDPYSE